MPAASGAAIVAVFAVIVAGIDQLTKAAIVAAIGPESVNSRIAVGDGWVALEYAENRGAAFGLFSSLTPVLIFVSIAILAGVLVQFMRSSNPTLLRIISVGAIVGGALGNLIDRARLGYVVDFVAIGPWPNFNVADTAITLGALGVIWGWVRPVRSDLASGAS